MYISKTEKAKRILKISLCALAVCLAGCAAYIGIYVSRIWAAPDFNVSEAAIDDYETDFYIAEALMKRK